MIKCVIVEDEVAGQFLLQRKIKKHFPICNVEAVIDNRKEAVQYLNNHTVDLVFMDVQVKGGTGIDILKDIREPKFETIFITAYADYAIEALNKNASYYLLKPIKDEDFVLGMEVVLEKIQGNKGNAGVFVTRKGEQFFVSFKDIIFLESDGSYSHLYTIDERIMSSKNLGHYEKLLPEDQFVRTHHSYVVNAHHIKKITKSRGATLTMTNDYEVPVAQRRVSDLQNYIVE